MTHEVVVKGGRVALDDGWRDCDIGIDGGKITAVGGDLNGSEVIDATELWVLPGGIDVHCHLDQPAWGGATTADDFESGSISAAFGGTTCIVPFAMPGPGMTSLQALRRALGCAAGRSVIDYGLHGVVTPETGDHLDRQFACLAEAGVGSVKVFMTYVGFAVSDDLLLAVMDAARRFGLVVMIHAENDAGIRRTRDRLIGLGLTHLRYHTVAHSEILEREATHRAVAFAELTGARIVIVHVSSCQSAEEIARGRQRGADVVAETCPQYLFLAASDLDRSPPEAARYVFSPPPRSRASPDHLWKELAGGGIDLWSSDHSPYYLADKAGASGRYVFHETVSGVPGIETRLPLLFSEGLLERKLPLGRYLDLASRKAAEVFGLAHVKGRIEPGLDADLAIWDPRYEWRISQPVLHSRVDFTPFEGRKVTGRPITVLVRGTPVIRELSLCAGTGSGRFVARQPIDIRQFKKPIEETTPWRDS